MKHRVDYNRVAVCCGKDFEASKALRNKKKLLELLK